MYVHVFQSLLNCMLISPMEDRILISLTLRFSFSSIEQQYVAESLQNISHHQVHKPMGKVCNTVSSLEKQAKCDQSSGSYNRGYLNMSCTSYDLDANLTRRKLHTAVRENHERRKELDTVEVYTKETVVPSSDSSRQHVIWYEYIY